MRSRPLCALLLSILIICVFLPDTSQAQQSDPGDQNLNERFCDRYPREKIRIDNRLRAFKRLAKFNKATQRTCLQFTNAYKNLCKSREHLIALCIQLCQIFPDQSDPLSNCDISDEICGEVENQDNF